jgi:hypothetical protein
MKKTPDQVCAEARNIKLTLKPLEDESYVFIEGDKAAFHWLSDLFAAHADFDKDCGFQMGPNGPGNSFFKKGSKLGVYLHRLPCVEKKSSK